MPFARQTVQAFFIGSPCYDGQVTVRRQPFEHGTSLDLP
jgi:hypothetical protein